MKYSEPTHDPTAKEYVACINGLRRRRGIPRKVLLALGAARRKKVWFLPTNKKSATLQAVKEFRRLGWRIQSRSVIQIGSWKFIRAVDMREDRPRLEERHWLTPQTREFVYRLQPGFVSGLRAWYVGARMVDVIKPPDPILLTSLGISVVKRPPEPPENDGPQSIFGETKATSYLRYKRGFSKYRRWKLKVRDLSKPEERKRRIGDR